jgi:hypothetical protein
MLYIFEKLPNCEYQYRFRLESNYDRVHREAYVGATLLAVVATGSESGQIIDTRVVNSKEGRWEVQRRSQALDDVSRPQEAAGLAPVLDDVFPAGTGTELQNQDDPAEGFLPPRPPNDEKSQPEQPSSNGSIPAHVQAIILFASIIAVLSITVIIIVSSSRRRGKSVRFEAGVDSFQAPPPLIPIQATDSMLRLEDYDQFSGNMNESIVIEESP